MKICMFTTAHGPFDSRIFHKESLSLKKAGYDMAIVAPYHKKNDNVKGIEIIGYNKYKTKIQRFMILRKIYILCKNTKADFYHFHDVELLPVGLLLRIFTKAKIIYDAHENFPYIIRSVPTVSRTTKFILSNLVDLLERVICPFMHYIVTVSGPLEKRYIEFNKNTEIIYNYVETNKFNMVEESPVLREKYRNYEVIIYEGGITKSRGIFQMMEAVREIRKKINNVKLLLVGRILHVMYKDKIDKYMEQHNLSENIEFVGSVNHQELSQYINLAKIGLIIFQPVPNNLIGTPVKQFEYMACGIPVVASKFPMIEKFVGGADSGILVDPTSVEEISNAVIHLLKNPEEARRMGKNGRKAIEDKYNWGEMEKILFGIYKKLVD